MKITGIIAEYNPFHTGHAYQARRARVLSKCDYVIACMSGSFTQRGEAACLPARERARAALLSGVDAVFELPALWAVRSADAFARGGVAILDGIGCDYLSFGTENEDLQLLNSLAELRIREPEAISLRIREALGRGENHARARGEAIAEYLGIDPEKLNAPNMILATEYLAAAKRLGSKMEMRPVLRTGEYHDLTLGEFASAGAIRAAWSQGETKALRFLPEIEADALKRETMHPMDDILLYKLRGMREEDMLELPDVAEGLERRMIRASNECGSREELIMRVKCKRYTYSRISRLCAHALLGITNDMTEKHPIPEYARLIGVRRDALPLLAELKERSRIPVVSDAKVLCDNEVFQLESRAADIRALLTDGDRKSGTLYREKFLII